MIHIEQLQKTYVTSSGAHEALRNVTFEIRPGELLSVVGPSGAGKSTLLKAIAGLQPPSAGQVRYLGAPIDAPHPDFAVVFQDYARSLYPWHSLERNITLALESRVADKAQRREIARRMLARVGLPGFEARRPTQLSGGQQQRVAIARALACAPKLLIMDEPFASVDAQTRFDLEDLVLSLTAESGCTTLLVTHDIDEAAYMSDRVVVLSAAPSVVAATIEIDLPKPRHQIETRALPAFAQARSEILQRVRQPVASDARRTIRFADASA